MDKRKLERIILLILALLNVFLLSVVLSDSAEDRRSAREIPVAAVSKKEGPGARKGAGSH